MADVRSSVGCRRCSCSRTSLAFDHAARSKATRDADCYALSSQPHSYGTLINEHILRRVIGRTSAASLRIQDAQLHGYCRLKLRHAHYPALVPVSVAQVALNRVPTLAEQTVSGKLVSGLTAAEVTLLDTFEGEEYQSQTAFVNLMDPNSPPVEAVVYLYAPPMASQNILPSLWSYDEFVRNHLAQWVADPNNF